MNDALAALAERLTTAGRVSADDVLALRAQVYGADLVDADEVGAMIAMDARLGERPAEWGVFLADVLVDYLVRQSDPQGYVDDAAAAALMQAMGERPARDGALAALARVIVEADQVPAALEDYALAKARAAVIAAGAVSAADVELLRALVFAGGGEGALGVTRAEADTLFDINDACHGAANDPAWTDFFAKAVADCLTAVSPFQPVGRDDESRDETWLNKRESLGGFLAGMVRAPDPAGFARDLPDIVDPFNTEAREWVDADAAIDRDEAAAADITDDEARWLVGRLSRERLNDAERALITALKGQAGQVSPLLQPLLGAAPASAPAAPSAAMAQPALSAAAAPMVAALQSAAPQSAAPQSAAPQSAAPQNAAPVFGHRKAMPG